LPEVLFCPQLSRLTERKVMSNNVLSIFLISENIIILTNYFFRILLPVVILMPLLFSKADVPGRILLATVILPVFSSSFINSGIFSV
jgi:hypothetical protein